VFETIGSDEHEEILFGHDPVCGLRTIIAIHSTVLGPALGGTRFFSYANEDDALVDAIRLSKGMTYKAAVAGLSLGGGKGVIIGDPAKIKTEQLLRAYGRTVESLGGRYITAEDVGTTTDDMITIRRETKHVTGLPTSHGGSGDPSPATARGVLAAMRATAMKAWGSDDLSGKTVAVQGVGKVGGDVVRRLSAVGAKTVITDVNDNTIRSIVESCGSTVVATEDIYDVNADIFAPCAMGASLSATTIPRLRCELVVGSANNQLATAEDAQRLIDRDIVYAPDFVVNAGGIINIGEEPPGYSEERAILAVERIYDTLTHVFATATDRGIGPSAAANAIAEERIAAARQQRPSSEHQEVRSA
jgi:leucine dehydrogenase